MMNHRGYAQSSAPAGHFIGTGEIVNSNSAGPVALSGGVLAGDIAVALAVAPTVVPSSLTHVLVNYSLTGLAARTSWQLLTAGDQAAQAISVNAGGVCTMLIAIYRGATVATQPTQGFNDNTVPSPVVCAGLTKNAASKALAYFVGAAANPHLGAGPGTLRHITSDGLVGLADFDPSSLYTNGTPESWAYTTLSSILLTPLDVH